MKTVKVAMSTKSLNQTISEGPTVPSKTKKVKMNLQKEKKLTWMPGKSLDNEMVTYLFIIFTGFAHTY